jgi:hypothetical protein
MNLQTHELLRALELENTGLKEENNDLGAQLLELADDYAELLNERDTLLRMVEALSRPKPQDTVRIVRHPILAKHPEPPLPIEDRPSLDEILNQLVPSRK